MENEAKIHSELKVCHITRLSLYLRIDTSGGGENFGALFH